MKDDALILNAVEDCIGADGRTRNFTDASARAREWDRKMGTGDQVRCLALENFSVPKAEWALTVTPAA